MNQIKILEEIERRTKQCEEDLRKLHQQGRSVDRLLSLYIQAGQCVHAQIAELRGFEPKLASKKEA